VGHGAADLLAGDVFPRHGLDDGGPRYVHDPHLIHHEDEVGEGRAIYRPPGTGAGNDGDLRHHARGQHVAEEDVAVPRKGVHGLLDAGSAGIVDADDGSAVFHRQVHDLADLAGVHLPQRPPHDGEVLAVDVDDPAIDGAVSRHHAVTGENGLLQAEISATVLHELVDLGEAPLVQELKDPLSGGKLTLLVLFGHGLFAPASLRRLSLGQHLLTELVYGLLRHAIPPHLAQRHHANPPRPKDLPGDPPASPCRISDFAPKAPTAPLPWPWGARRRCAPPPRRNGASRR